MQKKRRRVRKGVRRKEGSHNLQFFFGSFREKRREGESDLCVRREAPESDSKAKKGKGKNRGGEKGARECRGFVFPFFVLWYSVFFLYVSLWVLKVVTSFVTF